MVAVGVLMLSRSSSYFAVAARAVMKRPSLVSIYRPYRRWGQVTAVAFADYDPVHLIF